MICTISENRLVDAGQVVFLPRNITFENSEVDISGNGMGISVAPGGGTNITFDNSTGSVSAQNGTAIYGPEEKGNGDLTFTNGSDVTLNANL